METEEPCSVNPRLLRGINIAKEILFPYRLIVVKSLLILNSRKIQVANIQLFFDLEDSRRKWIWYSFIVPPKAYCKKTERKVVGWPKSSSSFFPGVMEKHKQTFWPIQ